MPNPVMVRDKFNTGKWYIYITADKTGTYWSRWEFSIPHASTADYKTVYNKYFTVQQVAFGKIRQGQTIRTAGGADSNWSESAAWVDFTTGTIWTGRHNHNDSRPAYATIPNTHNLIKILVASASDGTFLDIDWEDGTTDGLLVTAIDESAGTGIAEYTLATNANPNGRRLRFNKRAEGGTTKAVNVFGVRSWDTDSVGDPSTASGGIAVGHDFVDSIGGLVGANGIDYRIADTDNDPSMVVLSDGGSAACAHEWAARNGDLSNSIAASGTVADNGSGKVRITKTGCFASMTVGDYVWCVFSSSGSPFTTGFYKILAKAADTLDIELTWATSAQTVTVMNNSTTAWTGGAAHFQASDYSYTYNTGEFPNGPVIRLGISSVDYGAVWDSVANPQGKLHTDSSIHIRSNGYSKWTLGNGPKVEWMYNIGTQGISWTIGLIPVDHLCLLSSMYCPMWKVPTAFLDAGSYFTNPPYDTKNQMKITYATGATLDDNGGRVRITSTGSFKNLLAGGKVYCDFSGSSPFSDGEYTIYSKTDDAITLTTSWSASSQTCTVTNPSITVDGASMTELHFPGRGVLVRMTTTAPAASTYMEASTRKMYQKLDINSFPGNYCGAIGKLYENAANQFLIGGMIEVETYPWVDPDSRFGATGNRYGVPTVHSS